MYREEELSASLQFKALPKKSSLAPTFRLVLLLQDVDVGEGQGDHSLSHMCENCVGENLIEQLLGQITTSIEESNGNIEFIALERPMISHTESPQAHTYCLCMLLNGINCLPRGTYRYLLWVMGYFILTQRNQF